jgi:hypothetical protein
VQIQLKTHTHENTTYFKASILFNQTDNEIISNGGPLAKMGKGKELKTPERKSAFLMLESMSKDGVPERGSFHNRGRFISNK